MTSFTDTLALDFPLSDDEKEVIQLTHRWVSTYRKLMKGLDGIPEPSGTPYEVWSMANMVVMLWNVPCFPATQVRETVPTPSDFMSRVVALIRRLETVSVAEDLSLGRALSE